MAWLIVYVHGVFDSLGKSHDDCLDGKVDPLVNRSPLILARSAEYVFNVANLTLRSPYAYSNPNELLSAHGADDGLHAVVAAVAASGPDAHLPGRKRHLVIHNDKVLRRRAKPCKERRNCSPTFVHVRTRLCKDDAVTSHILLRRVHESMRTCRPAGVVFRNPVDAPKPNVVSGAFVLRSRISKTDNDSRNGTGTALVFPSEKLGECTAYHHIPP